MLMLGAHFYTHLALDVELLGQMFIYSPVPPLHLQAPGVSLVCAVFIVPWDA